MKRDYTREDRWSGWECFRVFLPIAGILVILAGVALGPIGVGIEHPYSNGAMQNCRTIQLSMFQYSNDNDQLYPDGKSSTEIFQKLLDGKYLSDPAIVYLPMPGKVKPVPGERLKPENVCYDITGGVDASSSDLLPTVFITGYRVGYAPHGTAVPLIKPYPIFWLKHRTLSQWWNNDAVDANQEPGLAVAYKGNNTIFLKLPNPEAPGAAVPDFVPEKFEAQGQVYRQLGPEGVVR